MAGDNSTEVGGIVNVTTQAKTFSDSGWLSADTFDFYMHCAVIGIGFVGIAANALVLYALIVHSAQQAKKRGVQLLIINQNLIDLCCCFTVVICLSLSIGNIYLTGVLGYILCAVIISENIAMCLLNASVINLMTLTIERYLKVVYPFWSKKNLKSWMVYAGIVFSWIVGILSMGPLGFVTSFVAEDVCLPFVLYWEDAGLKAGYGVWNFLSFFLLPLVIFVYCYGHIVVVMKRQMRVMAGHNVEGSAQNASQAQSRRVKWNIIKTMIIVSAFFLTCWFPMNIYIMVVENFVETREVALVVLFLPFINISLNPFIYATKHEGVRRILARLIICRKGDDIPGVGGPSGSNRNTGGSGTKTTKISVAPN